MRKQRNNSKKKHRNDKNLNGKNNQTIKLKKVMNQKLRICNTLSFIFIYIFNLSGFESIITGQTFKQLNHFSSLTSRSPADEKTSRSSQNDVTIVNKATVTFHRKTHKKV